MSKLICPHCGQEFDEVVYHITDADEVCSIVDDLILRESLTINQSVGPLCPYCLRLVSIVLNDESRH